jgi:predicted DNA-binding transcriptional regulator YafY
MVEDVIDATNNDFYLYKMLGTQRWSHQRMDCDYTRNLSSTQIQPLHLICKKSTVLLVVNETRN